MSRLNMDFDLEEDKALEFLKYEYGIKQTTELIRFLVRQAHKKFIDKEKENYLKFNNPNRLSPHKEALEKIIEKYMNEERLKKWKEKGEELL